jgi:hypothetical protein
MPRGREPDQEDDDSNSDNQFHVIQTKAIVDPMSERLYCPFCKSLMRYLPGFPVGHAQWLCEGCGHTAHEGYGDTPSHDSDYRTLSSPNDPYPTTENLSKAFVKDLPSDLDEEEPRGQWGKVDINTADRKKRYGMMFAYLTAQEASRQI